MPTVSRAQQRLMQAVAHGAKPKGGHGPSRAVAKDFVAADHARGATKLPERIAHAVISGKPKHKV
jgi:hypothetical protein